MDAKLDEEYKKIAEGIWKKILAFSGYGFNRSHACSYSLMSYQCQWLKANYPLEFWTTAFNFCEKGEVDIPFFLQEIKEARTKIKINNPDINKSDLKFTCDPDEQSIFWSLKKIKGAGDVASEKIIEVRGNEEYTSLENFLERVPKNKVNKKVVKSLILSGCFDILYNVQKATDRMIILLHYYSLIKEDATTCPILLHQDVDKNYYWILQQKSLIGNGELDYQEIIDASGIDDELRKIYISVPKFLKKAIPSGKHVRDTVHSVCGFVVNVKEYQYKTKAGSYCKIEIEANNKSLECIAWDSEYASLKDYLKDIKGKLILISGSARNDSHRNKNTLFLTNDTQIIEL
jgi:DNA polymerase III alpha subunit